MKNKVIVPAIAIIASGILIFGVPQANAQSQDEARTSLIQKIAQKFGLKQEDVLVVFDQHRQEQMAKMNANFEAKLTQDVKDGKLTDAQKQAIIAKRKELQTKRESDKANFKDMTAEQRKAAMDAERTELENWAKQNNIDVSYVMGMGKHVMKMRMNLHK